MCWLSCGTKFRPEFLNRLDDIVLFERLKRDQMTAIVDIQLKRLEALLADRKIVLELDQAAKEWLAQRGYEPAYGARPLKRVIQRFVQDPLAEAILAGDVKDGETVHVTTSPVIDWRSTAGCAGGALNCRRRQSNATRESGSSASRSAFGFARRIRSPLPRV